MYEPLMRFLAAIVAVGASLRLIVWLIAPIAPYLLAALVVFAVVRLVTWYRGRW